MAEGRGFVRVVGLQSLVWVVGGKAMEACDLDTVRGGQRVRT